MKLFFKTKPNTNGNIRQLVIDMDKKTVTSGNFLFTPSTDAIIVTNKQLKQIEQQTKNNL